MKYPRVFGYCGNDCYFDLSQILAVFPLEGTNISDLDGLFDLQRVADLSGVSWFQKTVIITRNNMAYIIDRGIQDVRKMMEANGIIIVGEDQ